MPMASPARERFSASSHLLNASCMGTYTAREALRLRLGWRPDKAFDHQPISSSLGMAYDNSFQLHHTKM